MTDLHEVIVSYNEYINNVPNGASYIAEQLTKGNKEPALVAIQDFSEGMLWLIEVQPLLQEYGMKVELPIHQIQDF